MTLTILMLYFDISAQFFGIIFNVFLVVSVDIVKVIVVIVFIYYNSIELEHIKENVK